MTAAIHVRDDFDGAADTPINDRTPNVLEGLSEFPTWISQTGSLNTYGLVMDGAGKALIRGQGE